MRKKVISVSGWLLAIMMMIGYVNVKAPEWIRSYYIRSYSSLKITDGQEFEKAIRNGTYNLIANSSWGTKPMAGTKSVWHYLRNRVIEKSNVMGYGEYGYLLHFAFLYAKERNDQEMLSIIKQKFDEYWINGGGNFERNDQVAYGNVAIDLYQHYGNEAYKIIADKIYARMDSIGKADGLILYREGTMEQHVDAIGLVCPFLFYYSDTFGVAHARELAARMAEEYVRYGADPITGIPCQTYDTKTHIKKNHANWGRGCSWYLMGTRMLHSADSVVAERLSCIDSTLVSVHSCLYPQYISENWSPDLSATIPILFHLEDHGMVSLSRDSIAGLLSPYIDDEGIIRFCSPSISYPHEGVSVWTTNLFCQGLLLYFIASLK